MRKARFCLALIALVTTACGVIRFGGDPSWTGALEVEAKRLWAC
jgi:hypothetical protein